MRSRLGATASVCALLGLLALGATVSEQHGSAAFRQLKFLLTDLTCSSQGACDLASGTTVDGEKLIGVYILGGDVSCAVSASYCTIWTIAGSDVSASRGFFLEGHLIVDANSTTVAPQFRVRSADTGYTGHCEWKLHEAGTATTADESLIVPIGSNPGDTAGINFFSTDPQPVWFDCALLADGTPGDIIVEWQLETGTSPTQTVLRGSYYTLIK